jgi:beta-mannosidase
MADQVRALFGEIPDNVADFSFASQTVQAEALKFFIERFRSTKWRRTGIIWWNVIDGWPQLSDAIVDYYFVKKRAYDVVKRSQAPLCLVLRESVDGVHELVACNDTRRDLPLAFSVRDVESGEIEVQGQGLAAGDAVTVMGTVPAQAGLLRAFLIEWTTPQGPGQNHYFAGPPPLPLARVRSWLQLVGL